MPRGNDIKTKDSSGACCQNGKYGPLYVSYSNYTNCKEKKLSVSFFFFSTFFYSPFHQMCVKCRYKALILARKSVQPFIINSHLNSFSFRLLLFFPPLLLMTMSRVCSETEKSVRRIKRSLGWRELVWWVMRWTNSKKKGGGGEEKYICQASSSWRPEDHSGVFFFCFVFCVTLYVAVVCLPWMLCVCIRRVVCNQRAGKGTVFCFFLTCKFCT